MMRKIISLNQNWKFYQNDQYSQIDLPHTWNAVDGQDGGNDYFRGSCRYVRELERPDMEAGNRVFLEVKGAAMSAQVYLNDKKLTEHQGGYSAFRVELTGYLQEKNELCITVDNSDNDTVYPQKADFTFYGGLYRDVNLIVVPKEHFDLSYCGAPGIRVTPVVNLAEKSAVVTVETWQTGTGEVTVTVDGKSRSVTPENGHARAVFEIADVHLWDGIKDPYLYTASASLASGDEISARFGCRAYTIDAQLSAAGRQPPSGLERRRQCADDGTSQKGYGDCPGTWSEYAAPRPLPARTGIL